MKMQKALTIAGSDPSGGAGIQADLKVFSAFKVYGMAVIAVLTAQNTEGIYGILDVSPGFLSRQMDILFKDIRPDAVKTGMLYSSDAITVVARKVEGFSLNNLVVDPVTVSTTESTLIEKGALDTLKDQLFPLAKVITPNIYEAEALTGVKIKDLEGMKESAVILKRFGPEAVIITGGHIPSSSKEIIDLLWDGKEYIEIRGKRFIGEYHGTGCVFSAAMAASLALGLSIKDSAIKAKDFVKMAIRGSSSLGKGLRTLTLKDISYPSP